MKFYLAGPMRGYPQYNFPVFDKARMKLTKMGYHVICPAEMDIVEGFNPDKPMKNEDIQKSFRRDILSLLDCGAIILLPGWQNSVGANTEVAIAEMLGLKIYEYAPDSEIGMTPLLTHYNMKEGGDKRFFGLTVEMCRLHAKKQQDYGLEGDPFSNVRASEAFGIPGWVGTLMRGQDKMKRLQKAAQGGTMSNESVEDSLIDLANYAIIALILYKEQLDERA